MAAIDQCLKQVHGDMKRKNDIYASHVKRKFVEYASCTSGNLLTGLNFRLIWLRYNRRWLVHAMHKGVPWGSPVICN